MAYTTNAINQGSGETGSTGCKTFVDISKISDKKGHNPLHFAAS